MKRVAVCVCILAALAVLGVILYIDTERNIADTEAKLELLEEAAVLGDRAYLSAGAKKLSDDWESFCRHNIFLTDNECAFEISQALIRIAAEAESGDGDAAEECRFACKLVEYYRRSRAFTLDNIF